MDTERLERAAIALRNVWAGQAANLVSWRNLPEGSKNAWREAARAAIEAWKGD